MARLVPIKRVAMNLNNLLQIGFVHLVVFFVGCGGSSDQVAQVFDLETVAVVGSDPAGSPLNELFAYWPEERAVVGQVDGPGLYQPHAMPLEASARRLIESLASGWNHIAHDSIRNLLSSQSGISARSFSVSKPSR